MKLTIRQFDLPLRHRFTISRESTDVQPTLVVQVSEGGCSGFGEATCNAYYGVSIESMTDALMSVASEIESMDCQDPALLWQRFDSELSSNRFAQCALDQALHDLWGKLQGKSLWQLWGLDIQRNPVSDYTIGIDTIDQMIAKMNEFPDWPIYKIKLGTDQDLDIVRSLREHTSATFRVDANCGWTPTQTIELAPQLKTLGVEFIEQPLPADCWDEMREVRAKSELPIIADESCQQEPDVERCHECFDGVNIKLVKCGGLTPAKRMIETSRRLGMKTMVGCMTESTVGISAIAQLLPLLDYVDMDGAVLISRDIATGVVLEKGVCRYSPDVMGSGVTLLGQS